MKKFICFMLALTLIFIPTYGVFANTSNSFSSLVLVNTKKYKIDALEYEEYFYKPSSKINVKSTNILSVEPMAIAPEEGDFKIVIIKGTVSGKDWFNSVEDYLLNLQTNGVYNAANIATNFFSNPIASFFLVQRLIIYIKV